MAEPSKGGGFTTLLNVGLIVVTIVGFLTLVRKELTSDRPAPPAGSSGGAIGTQTVDARLWEDPFRPPPKKDEPPRRSIEELVSEIRGKAASRDVWLLPVMVSGGPYSEDREDRIRSRFAVVSALGRRHYVPKDEAHLGYVVTPWPSTRELSDWARVTFLPGLTDPGARMPCDVPFRCSETLAIPYEWYRSKVFQPKRQDASGDDVLVLWLDERFFADDPTSRLPILLANLIEASRGQSGMIGKPAPVVRLIGPQTSKTLRAMLRNKLGEGDPPVPDEALAGWTTARQALAAIEIYSATASAMDDVLVLDGPANGAPREHVRERLEQLGFHGAHFLNADDAHLADEVLNELARRGVCLPGRKPACAGPKSDHIVLLSEWDTFYGRMLSLTYGTVLIRDTNSEVTPSEIVRKHLADEIRLPSNLHSFVYLRGLDGRTVQDADAASRDSSSNAKTRDRPESLQAVVEWKPEENKAEGPWQFDYLSRTGEALAALQARLRMRDEGEIKAVGIVGSDTYDALLILQALRPRLPDVLFFTTKLDARLWNPRYRDWSRNLIVASSYGLALDPAIQGDVAPFRDSTQTALFAATFSALGPIKADAAGASAAPRLFEIGNTTAVDLSGPNTGWAIHPKPRNEETDQHRDFALRLTLFLMALLAALGLWFWRGPMRMRSAQACGYLTGCFPLSDPDVGGPEGAASLLKALSASADDPLCADVALRYEERLGSPPGKAVVPTVEHEVVPPGSVAAARAVRVEPTRLLAPAPGGPAGGVVAVEGAVQRAETFVSVLNDIVVHTLRLDRIELDRSDLVDQAFVERAAPWMEPAARWNPIGGLRQRFRTRALVDQFLDRLTRKTDNPEQLELLVARNARFAARRVFLVRLQLVMAITALALVASLVGGLMLHAIWGDTFWRWDGEPFSLMAGTSAWPNLVLRVVSTFLALAFVCWLFEQLRVLFYRITRVYRLPLTSSARAASPLRVQASALWEEYHVRGEVLRRLGRAVVPTLLYFGCARVVLYLFGFPFQPLRGEAVTTWAYAVRFPFVLSFLLLSFLTVDAALRCRHFITALASLPTHYPKTTLDYFQRQRGGVGEEYLEEWIDIQLIADLTEGVGKLLWFPCIVFLLMVLSLNSWTDRWPLSTGLMLVLLVNFGLSIVSVVILQSAAQTARKHAEESLTAKVKRAQAFIAESREHNNATQAEKLLEEIRTLDRGAFVGFWQNPALGAVLVPSGGTAVIQLLLWVWS
jgi:hypothetical protein